MVQSKTDCLRPGFDAENFLNQPWTWPSAAIGMAKDLRLSPTVAQALNGLDCELRAVLEHSFGIRGENEQSDEAVASTLGTTGECIARLKEDALRALYTPAQRAKPADGAVASRTDDDGGQPAEPQPSPKAAPRRNKEPRF